MLIHTGTHTHIDKATRTKDTKKIWKHWTFYHAMRVWVRLRVRFFDITKHKKLSGLSMNFRCKMKSKVRLLFALKWIFIQVFFFCRHVCCNFAWMNDSILINHFFFHENGLFVNREVAWIFLRSVRFIASLIHFKRVLLDKRNWNKVRRMCCFTSVCLCG